jgi:hypothetical protein
VGFASLSTAAMQSTQEGGNLPTPTVLAHPIVATGATLSNQDKKTWASYAIWTTVAALLSMLG